MTIEIANRLCAYRRSIGFSQEELAEKVGVTRQAVSKWERAEASPDTDNLILLAQIYGVTLDELLNRDPKEPTGETAEEAARPDRDYVSFKNGIHVHSKNGDRVDIGLSGIHVEEHKGDSVHIGWDGIHVEEDGHIHITDQNGQPVWDCERQKELNRWHKFPWALLCCIAYLLMGGFNVLGGWSYGWLIFLTVPIYHSLGEAMFRKNFTLFCYPAVAALIFLCLGFFCGMWHPGWIIFITIPLYYCICKLFETKKPENSEFCDKCDK